MSQKARSKRILTILKIVAFEDKPIAVDKLYSKSVSLDGVCLRKFREYLKVLSQAHFIKLTSEGKWIITDAGKTYLIRKGELDI